LKLIKILNILCNNNYYDVYWYEKDIKNGYLKIENNKIVFTSSSDLDEDFAKIFITNNIHKMIVRLKNSNNLFYFNCENPWFILNEKKYYIKSSIKIRNKVMISGSNFYIRNKKLSENIIKKSFSDYFFNHIEKIFQEMLIKTGKEAKLVLKWSSNRWGYCYPSKKEIYLNPKLIFFSKQQIQAVCLHEIAHLDYPYHDSNFYKYIYKYMKEYKTLKERLDKYEFFKI
jgi:predicted metal-dependent hydrolase